MNDSLIKPVLAGMCRHALTVAGGALVADGYLQSSGTADFVGGGMVLAGVAWSWWQKVGQKRTTELLKGTIDRLASRGVAQAQQSAASTPIDKPS